MSLHLLCNWSQLSSWPFGLLKAVYLTTFSPLFATQSVAHRPAALIPPGNLLEMQNLGPHSRPAEPESSFSQDVQVIRIRSIAHKDLTLLSIG